MKKRKVNRVLERGEVGYDYKGEIGFNIRIVCFLVLFFNYFVFSM